MNDTTGEIHAAFVNEGGGVSHYTKAVGFNDDWVMTAVIPQIDTPADRIAFSGVEIGAEPPLRLYSAREQLIVVHELDTSWSAELTVANTSAPIVGALAPTACGSCVPGIAWAEGAAPPMR